MIPFTRIRTAIIFIRRAEEYISSEINITGTDVNIKKDQYMLQIPKTEKPEMLPLRLLPVILRQTL